MRILHVSKKYPNAIGGDASVVYNLYMHQKQEGHEVTILTTNCREIIQEKNVIKCGIPDNSKNYDRITLKRVLSLSIFFLASFHILALIKPDIIHSHSPDMGFLVSVPAKLFRIPIIHTCHGVCFNDSSFSFLKRSLELFLLRYGGFQCISTVDKTSLPDFFAEGIDHVEYIPNGVDIELFSLSHRQDIAEISNFLFVGRLERQKGLDVLIDAVVDLKKIKSNLKVLLIGDGSQKDELIRCISDHSLENTIYMMGAVTRDELIRKFAESDAFVLPSRWEGLPLTILEAWAAGLPAVVTNVGGLGSLCEHLVNAVVVNPGDSRALCQGMRFLMENPTIAKRLGSEGNRVARVHYSWDAISRRYEDVYYGLVLCDKA